MKIMVDKMVMGTKAIPNWDSKIGFLSYLALYFKKISMVEFLYRNCIHKKTKTLSYGSPFYLATNKRINLMKWGQY